VKKHCHITRKQPNIIFGENMITLYDYQKEAVNKLKTGSILCGGMGSGKSFTALYYYYIQQGGIMGKYVELKNPKSLYIITTAMKRDKRDWEKEAVPFLFKNMIIDSWNNIGKYKDITNAFFIFDEHRLSSFKKWAKSFIKIGLHNDWILLSATPGDKWEDYMPVFIANGFYRNKKDFVDQHIIYKPFVNYPQIDRYVNTGRLLRLRNNILVDMDYQRRTESHHEDIYCKYDINKYKTISRERWDPYEDEPIETASEYCYILRKVCNSDESRQVAVLEIFEKHPRVIIFYNFDYELDILKNISYGSDVEIAEWNGHKHQEIPESEKWVYLVQYNAGAEGWNCIKTDTIIFYSQNYSYKTMVQASGRIDRLNTPYKDLYYYHLKSRSGIDVAISKALDGKKKFNEARFYYK
jgi:hypothetical protein